mmetsp:Transcript_61450/g.146569  ORF Transcript_61450/g.146569 Transcript_61450/m.146569 type:complete len:274 (+) Transcript_61450:621-1442(+)
MRRYAIGMLELGRSAVSLNQAGKDALLSRDVGGALRNASPMQDPSLGKGRTQEHAPHRSVAKLPKACRWCRGRVQRRQCRAPTPGDPRKGAHQGRPIAEPMPVVQNCLRRLHLRTRSLSQALCRNRRGPGRAPGPGQGPGGSPCEGQTGQTSAGAMAIKLRQRLNILQRHAELCLLRGCGSRPAAQLHQMCLQPPSQHNAASARKDDPSGRGVLFLRCPTWKALRAQSRRLGRCSEQDDPSRRRTSKRHRGILEAPVRHRPDCLDRSLRMSHN